MIYSLLTLPLFRFLLSAAGRRAIGRLARFCRRPGGLYVFALPLLAVQLALAGTEPTTMFQALVNDWRYFASLLLVFVFGFILISDARFQAAIAAQWKLALALALAVSAAMFAFAWPDDFNPLYDLPRDYSWRYAAFWTLYVLGTWSWLIAWLGFGQRYLNLNSPLRKHAAAASYPVYLLHYVVLLPAVLVLAPWPVDALVGSGTLLAVTLAGTLALVTLLSRWPSTRFVLGLKGQLRPRAEPLNRPAGGERGAGGGGRDAQRTALVLLHH